MPLFLGPSRLTSGATGSGGSWIAAAGLPSGPRRYKRGWKGRDRPPSGELPDLILPAIGQPCPAMPAPTGGGPAWEPGTGHRLQRRAQRFRGAVDPSVWLHSYWSWAEAHASFHPSAHFSSHSNGPLGSPLPDAKRTCRRMAIRERQEGTALLPGAPRAGSPLVAGSGSATPVKTAVPSRLWLKRRGRPHSSPGRQNTSHFSTLRAQ